MPYGTVNADVIQSSVSGVSLGAGNASIMKNRIINGAMVIDQRNAGASVTANDAVYPVDRFRYTMSQSSKGTSQQSTTAPVGFSNSVLFTSSSAYSVLTNDYFGLFQSIEGYNIADLSWGTANAKTVTLSFQVRCSLTGTFTGSLFNSAANRWYVFSYSIPVANTWTSISITIPGDTSGTWLTTNGLGLAVLWSLGAGSGQQGTPGSWGSTVYRAGTGQTSVVGTNGATFYITGVQLEVGSSATGYEYRQYQQELALCQRYYQTYPSGTVYLLPVTPTSSYNWFGGSIMFPVDMRATPTLTVTNNAFWGGGATGTIQSTGVNSKSIFQMLTTNNSQSAVGFNYTVSAEL